MNIYLFYKDDQRKFDKKGNEAMDWEERYESISFRSINKH